jgi:hypothetical protein
MIPFNICICFKFPSTALSGPNPNYMCFIKIFLSPEQMEKSDIIFKASFNEFSSSVRDNVESSAYWLIRNSELLILIPLIFAAQVAPQQL